MIKNYEETTIKILYNSLFLNNITKLTLINQKKKKLLKNFNLNSNQKSFI